MKIFFTIVSLFFVMIFNQQYANAQIDAGGGLFISTDETFDLGIDFRGTYLFNEQWRGALELDIFFPKKEEFYFLGTSSEIKYSAFSFSAEANYLFQVNHQVIKPYVLSGLNFVNVAVKAETSGIYGNSIDYAEADDSGLSLNIGAGSDFNINKSFKPFAEFKYCIGDADYAIILAGLKFKIK